MSHKLGENLSPKLEGKLCPILIGDLGGLKPLSTLYALCTLLHRNRVEHARYNESYMNVKMWTDSQKSQTAA